MERNEIKVDYDFFVSLKGICVMKIVILVMYIFV